MDRYAIGFYNGMPATPGNAHTTFVEASSEEAAVDVLMAEWPLAIPFSIRLATPDEAGLRGAVAKS
jgi:hypothetical protein